MYFHSKTLNDQIVGVDKEQDQKMVEILIHCLDGDFT